MLLRNALSYFIVAIVVIGCSSAQQLQPRPDALVFAPVEFKFPQVQKERLLHGSHLYTLEDHELPLVDITLMVEGGNIYDPIDKAGLSQLFAMVLATGGAGNWSAVELEQQLETMAAKLQVSAKDYHFQVTMSLRQEDLAQGLDLLFAVLRHPHFEEDRFNVAKEKFLTAIMCSRDEPDDIAQKLLGEALAAGHPLGTSPTGLSVNSITRKDLLDLHERFFNPANLWFAVSGDIDSEDISARLNQELETWPQGETWVRNFQTLPEQPPARVIMQDKKIPQTKILIGQQGISKDNPDQFALQVANFILGGGGFNSRMMREVRSNRGLAYSVYSDFGIGRHLSGNFVATCETKNESTAEVVALMRQLIEQMIDQPVKEHELELAKQSLINSFVFAFEDSAAVVARTMRLDYFGYPEGFMEKYRQHIASVTVEDVQRVCRTYLHPDKLQIILVGDSVSLSGQVTDLGLPVEKAHNEE